MEITRDEVLTMNAVLYVLIEEIPYREANKYLGDITLDRAYDLYKRLDAEINKEA